MSPQRRISQPWPPPSVNPATPVDEMMPPVVARPNGSVARSKSFQVSPGSVTITRRAESTRAAFIAERSIIRPPSTTALPVTLWPPPRTEIGRS